MIYTLISDISLYKKEVDTDADRDCGKGQRQNLNINEKRDCCILRQPLSLLPDNINNLISDTKNELARKERLLAYTTLLCGLKLFFGIDHCTVEKTSEGMPYLAYCYADNPDEGLIKYQKNEDESLLHWYNQKNEDFSSKDCAVRLSEISISISHSNGVAAVSISDEGEVGVDIQRRITAEKAKKLGERFFKNISVKAKPMNIKYYYCSLNENEAVFSEISLEDASYRDFTSVWSYSESIIKLCGTGFKDQSRVNELASGIDSELKIYESSTIYTLATSVRRINSGEEK